MRHFSSLSRRWAVLTALSLIATDGQAQAGAAPGAAPAVASAAARPAADQWRGLHWRNIGPEGNRFSTAAKLS